MSIFQYAIITVAKVHTSIYAHTQSTLFQFVSYNTIGDK